MSQLIFVLLFGLLTGLPISAAAEVPCPDDPYHPSGGAVIASVFRPVEVQRGGTGAWIPAEQYMPVCTNDRVRTRDGARARLEFDDVDEANKRGPSVVNLGPDTEIAIEMYMRLSEGDSERDKATFLGLIKGTIRTFMKHVTDNAAFRVRTGTSICGIRGTTAGSVWDPQASSGYHAVHDGMMVCTRQGVEVRITDQQQIAIGPAGSGEVEPLDEARWTALTEAVDAGDGWLPPPPLVDGCAGPVQIGSEVRTDRYKLCDPNASVIYQACVVSRCIAPADKDTLLSKKPGFTAEQIESPPGYCQPACEEGYSRWSTVKGRKLCGRCYPGTRFHRGLGCCI